MMVSRSVKARVTKRNGQKEVQHGSGYNQKVGRKGDMSLTKSRFEVLMEGDAEETVEREGQDPRFITKGGVNNLT